MIPLDTQKYRNISFIWKTNFWLKSDQTLTLRKHWSCRVGEDLKHQEALWASCLINVIGFSLQLKKHYLAVLKINFIFLFNPSSLFFTSSLQMFVWGSIRWSSTFLISIHDKFHKQGNRPRQTKHKVGHCTDSVSYDTKLTTCTEKTCVWRDEMKELYIYYSLSRFPPAGELMESIRSCALPPIRTICVGGEGARSFCGASRVSS